MTKKNSKEPGGKRVRSVRGKGKSTKTQKKESMVMPEVHEESKELEPIICNCPPDGGCNICGGGGFIKEDKLKALNGQALTEELCDENKPLIPKIEKPTQKENPKAKCPECHCVGDSQQAQPWEFSDSIERYRCKQCGVMYKIDVATGGYID